MKLLVSIVALALASGAAFADGGHKTPLREFSYRLKVPAVAGQTCAQNAEGVAQRFAMATKKVAQEVNGQCQTELKDPAALDVVVVNYHAETEVRPYTASFSGTTYEKSTEKFFEPFKTYAECAAQLGDQAQKFTALTGLNVLAAHCEASQYNSEEGFTLQVEGIGQPAQRLYSFQNKSSSFDDYSVLVPYAAATLKELGATIVAQDSVRVFYYSKAVLALKLDHFSMYLANECEGQKNAASDILTATGQTNINVICVAEAYDMQSMISLSVGYNQLNDDYGYNSPVYSSGEECRSDRSRLLSQAKSTHRIVYGALCERSSRATKGYELHIFGAN